MCLPRQIQNSMCDSHQVSAFGSKSPRNPSVVFKIRHPNHFSTQDLPFSGPQPESSPLQLHTKHFLLEPCSPLPRNWNRPNHGSCCIKEWLKQNLILTCRPCPFGLSWVQTAWDFLDLRLSWWICTKQCHRLFFLCHRDLKLWSLKIEYFLVFPFNTGNLMTQLKA